MLLDAARLPHSFYEGETTEVARALLGKLLFRRSPKGEILVGRIVETEAYCGPDDQASHAHRGLTKRTAPMFGPGGFAYVFQIYGMWFCMNAVTGPSGFPAAVLIRAIAELPGYPLGGERAGAGPGKLCRAFEINTSLSGADLVSGQDVWLAEDTFSSSSIEAGPRIGVDYAGEWAQRPWRFWLSGHPAVSR